MLTVTIFLKTTQTDAPTPLLIRVVVPATGKRTRGDAPALLALLLASTPTAPDTQSAGRRADQKGGAVEGS